MIEPSSDDDDDELKELRRKIQSADLPEHAMKAAQKELKVNLILWQIVDYFFIETSCFTKSLSRAFSFQVLSILVYIF